MNADEFKTLVSKERLQTYMRDGASDATAFSRYQYNIRLSEALLPTLHYFEVSLRNRLNAAIARRYGDRWLFIGEDSRFPFGERDVKKIADCIQSFLRVKKRAPTPSDIVSQLSLGFWVALFHKNYDPYLWQQKIVLQQAFPHLRRAARTRAYIEPRLQQIKALRNRIAHHEQILYLPTPAHETYRLCQEAIGYLSRDALEALEQIDRFPQVSQETP